MTLIYWLILIIFTQPIKFFDKVSLNLDQKKIYSLNDWWLNDDDILDLTYYKQNTFEFKIFNFDT